jgi:hypothetical protein
MSAARKCDQEFRERAVRMYRERLAELGESKRGARRHVGALLDLNRRRCGTGPRSGTGSSPAVARHRGRRNRRRSGCCAGG